MTTSDENSVTHKILPWGRSFEEYLRMFALSEEQLSRSILDCAGGPASFNAEVHRRGRRVVSCDPLYRKYPPRLTTLCRPSSKAADQNRASFIWSEIAPPEEMGKLRISAMKELLADFPAGTREGRYVVVALPGLPFRSRQFGIALCSHFLCRRFKRHLF